jgi:hypothetical protein
LTADVCWSLQDYETSHIAHAVLASDSTATLGRTALLLSLAGVERLLARRSVLGALGKNEHLFAGLTDFMRSSLVNNLRVLQSGPAHFHHTPVRSRTVDRKAKLSTRGGKDRGQTPRSAAAAQPTSAAQRERTEPADTHKRTAAAERTTSLRDDDESSSGDGSWSSGSSSEANCGVHCITARRQVLGKWEYKGERICSAQV